MSSHQFTLNINLYKRTGINNLGLFADVLKRYRVIMFIPAQIDAIVLGILQFCLVSYFKRMDRQYPEKCFFFCKKLFFPAIRFLLHTGLVVFPRFFF